MIFIKVIPSANKPHPLAATRISTNQIPLFFSRWLSSEYFCQKASEYDKETPQSHSDTAYQPTAP